MRILVIGSQGFVGSHVLSELIITLGSNSIYSTSAKDGKFLKSNHCDEIRVTSENVKTLSDFIMTNKINCIVNAAGNISPKLNNNPDLEIAKTIVNSLLKSEKKPLIIHIGSSSEYSLFGRGILTTETSECHPSSLYGKNKLAATEYLVNASEQFKFKLCVCRVFNVIGPRMNIKTILGKLYNEIFLDGRKNIKFGSLESYRDYMDIRDMSAAIVKLIININNLPYFLEIVNIGSGDVINIRSLIDQIRNASNKVFDFKEVGDEKRSSKDDCQQANIEKIKNIIDWSPKFRISESIHYFLHKEENVN